MNTMLRRRQIHEVSAEQIAPVRGGKAPRWGGHARLVVVKSRRREPRETLAEVEKRLAKRRRARLLYRFGPFRTPGA